MPRSTRRRRSASAAWPRTPPRWPAPRRPRIAPACAAVAPAPRRVSLTEDCPVNIFKQAASGTLEIVEPDLDERTLCDLCIRDAPAGTRHQALRAPSLDIRSSRYVVSGRGSARLPFRPQPRVAQSAKHAREKRDCAVRGGAYFNGHVSSAETRRLRSAEALLWLLPAGELSESEADPQDAALMRRYGWRWPVA